MQEGEDELRERTPGKTQSITLAKALEGYDEQIVRIGTEGSGYFVCGSLTPDLLYDMEHLEDLRKEQKRRVIESMEESLPLIRSKLPGQKKTAIALAEIREDKQKIRDIAVACMKTVSERRMRRYERLAKLADEFLERQRLANEEEIGGLSGKAKAEARRSFTTYARKRKTRYKARLNNYLDYLRREEKRWKEKADNAEEDYKKIVKECEAADRTLAHAKAKLETWPAKIRSGKKYLANYKAFIDRPLVEKYTGPVHKDETSFIIRGAEAGYFWDVEEFEYWKDTGLFPSEKEKED